MKEQRMDLVANPIGDDLDLDALMVRVREAARAGGPSGGATRPQTGGDANGADSDLVQVLDAQAEWNEQTRQALAALVAGLRTLRDDWTDAHARLRDELSQLSALVAELRSGTSAAAPRAKQPAGKSKRARGASKARTPATRRASNGRRRRS
jgi:hypothetical protein